MSDRRRSINVLGSPLEECGTQPMTGFWRDGCCETGPDDVGLHTVCCIMTDDFLRFQWEIGNDLVTPRPEYAFPGLKRGDRWCVCVTRVLQAIEAGVPVKIVLEATHEHALEYITMEDLKRHAAV